MQKALINKLHQYIRENNPDLLLSLQEKNSVTAYLNQKVSNTNLLVEQLQDLNTPSYIIEDMCMEELTRDLCPSKYNYISNILEEDFEFAYLQFQKRNTLLYEVINMISQCESVFETLGFTEENEDKRQLRYAVAGIIDKYLSK